MANSQEHMTGNMRGTAGKVKQQRKSWISAQSLHKMDERRQLKTEVNNARTRGRDIRRKRRSTNIRRKIKSKRASDNINANICRTWQLKERKLSPKEI